MNIKSSISGLRTSASKDKKFVTTSTNWIVKKNEEEKIKK